MGNYQKTKNLKFELKFTFLIIKFTYRILLKFEKIPLIKNTHKKINMTVETHFF